MKFKSIAVGLLLVALGLIFGLNALGIADIDLFFDGWWTLFIIVPCFIGLFQDREKTGNLIGLTIGITLLLVCQDLISFDLVMDLLLPVILVIAGLSIIFKNFLGDRAARRFITQNKNDPNAREYCSTFSGQKLNFYGEHFQGAKLTAVFGGIECDLTGAVIDHDVVVDCSAIFGGIDVTVPSDYRVKICSNSIFGGVDEERPHAKQDGAITVYINANCMFGGVDVK